jgi:hypothetical protein
MVDMRKKSFTEFKHQQAILCQVSYIKTMLGKDFITIGRSGDYIAWSKQLEWTQIGIFHPS